MVSWPAQTVAGAIATGTHGSTLMDGSLSSQVPLIQISWTVWKLRSVTQLLAALQFTQSVCLLSPQCQAH